MGFFDRIIGGEAPDSENAVPVPIPSAERGESLRGRFSEVKNNISGILEKKKESFIAGMEDFSGDPFVRGLVKRAALTLAVSLIVSIMHGEPNMIASATMDGLSGIDFRGDMDLNLTNDFSLDGIINESLNNSHIEPVISAPISAEQYPVTDLPMHGELLKSDGLIHAGSGEHLNNISEFKSHENEIIIPDPSKIRADEINSAFSDAEQLNPVAANDPATNLPLGKESAQNNFVHIKEGGNNLPESIGLELEGQSNPDIVNNAEIVHSLENNSIDRQNLQNLGGNFENDEVKDLSGLDDNSDKFKTIELGDNSGKDNVAQYLGADSKKYDSPIELGAKHGNVENFKDLGQGGQSPGKSDNIVNTRGEAGKEILKKLLKK
jgi:hypothetical protein